ncbi:MAG: SpoIIE family protein phosphatase [Chloroflexota bacterium]
MLTLRDLFPFSEVRPLLEELLAPAPGLTIVAGLDTRPGDFFLPSGRAAIFQTLFEQILAGGKIGRCTIVGADKAAVRIPRKTSRYVSFAGVESPLTYESRVREAILQRVQLLVVDRLDEQSIPWALEAARNGLRVLSQLDTVLSGAGVVRSLLDMGAKTSQLSGLAWILAVQRIPALCANCRYPGSIPEPHRRDKPLRDAPETLAGSYFRAGGCDACHHTGRAGDVGLVDIYRAGGSPAVLPNLPSLFSLQDSVWELAGRGRIHLDDALHYEQDQLRRTFALLAARERVLRETALQEQARRAELQAANRVLEHRTQVLFSLEALSQALIGTTNVYDLGEKVCHQAGELCAADRAVVYFRRSPEQAILLASTGWERATLSSWLDADQIFPPRMPLRAIPFHRCPPGFSIDDEEQKSIRSGLAVPLVAQDQLVGLMIVHSTRKLQFSPGEIALLQTFANQAALALQRAGLVEQLQAKIVQLEAAQAGLAAKERLEHELALARSVQQSMLPHTFPKIPGCRFVAHSEPARQVGGDFYDVIALPDGRLGLVIGDVSDKGMPAALYMAITRSLLRAEAWQTAAPASTLRRLNQLLLELTDPGMFVTLFYGVFDPVSRQIKYARAAHNRPLLLRNGQVSELAGQGMPLGTFPDDMLVLSEEQALLGSGDRLLLYTDGLTDAMSPDEQPFGLERLLSFLPCCAALPPDAILQQLFAAVADFRGPADPFDDMALLIMEIGEGDVCTH